MSPRILPILATALALVAGSAAAQAQSGGLVGTVRAADGGRPLGAALVTLRGTLFRTLTDPDGAFRLPGVPPGRYTLEVRVIGHRPQEVPAEVREGMTTRVGIDLPMQPIALAPIRVEAEARRGRTASVMHGFYERMEKGRGHFVTREDIEARNPRTLAQTLEMVPGIRILPRVSELGFADYVVQTSRNVSSSSYECPVAYFLDGAPFRPGSLGANAEIRPGDIEGIEVYTGPATVPPQFNQAGAGAACGVIVIWTRMGS